MNNQIFIVSVDMNLFPTFSTSIDMELGSGLNTEVNTQFQGAMIVNHIAHYPSVDDFPLIGDVAFIYIDDTYGYGYTYNQTDEKYYSLGLIGTDIILSYYIICSTASDVSAKTATLDGYVLNIGQSIYVQFDYNNTALNPTLNINNTGNIPLFYNNISFSPEANTIYNFIYDGTNYVLINGVKGEDGYTPVKGVDYYTEEEQEELITTIVNQINISGDASYVHDQIASSDVWTVNHNLNKHPSVTVVDTGDSVVVGEITYTSLNQVVLTFIAEFSGKAYLN